MTSSLVCRICRESTSSSINCNSLGGCHCIYVQKKAALLSISFEVYIQVSVADIHKTHWYLNPVMIEDVEVLNQYLIVSPMSPSKGRYTSQVHCLLAIVAKVNAWCKCCKGDVSWEGWSGEVQRNLAASLHCILSVIARTQIRLCLLTNSSLHVVISHDELCVKL